MSKKPPASIEEMVKIVEEAGFIVKKQVEYVKQSFQFEKPLLAEFRSLVKTKRIKLKDAANEAFRNWIEANKK